MKPIVIFNIFVIVIFLRFFFFFFLERTVIFGALQHHSCKLSKQW